MEGNSQTEKELRPHGQLSSWLFIVDVEFFVSVCAGSELQFIAIETKEAGKAHVCVCILLRNLQAFERVRQGR